MTFGMKKKNLISNTSFSQLLQGVPFYDELSITEV